MHSFKRTKELTVAAVLTALSFILNYLPFFKVPWGMQLDFVGAIWVLAFFAFGIRTSLFTALGTAILFVFFTPSGWIGAFIKFVVTFSMVLVFYGVQLLAKKKPNYFSKLIPFIIAFVLAIGLRIALATSIDLWLIPIFTGWPLSSITPLIPEIILLNFVLGAIDLIIAYVLAFYFKIAERFR